MTETHICKSPEATFELGKSIGRSLNGGEVLLLTGGLGAGKTLFTKGVLNALGFDENDVTSPSFTLVNLYKTGNFTVYHIDLWRVEGKDAAFAVGLDEILETQDSIVIIEWADRLGPFVFSQKVINIEIAGEGDDVREITIRTRENPASELLK